MKHAQVRLSHRTLHDDGVPHLAYHTWNSRLGEPVSFVWNMDREQPIEVQPGGYGEPVTHIIWNLGEGRGSLATDLWLSSAVEGDWVHGGMERSLAAWFKEKCEFWLARMVSGQTGTAELEYLVRSHHA